MEELKTMIRLFSPGPDLPGYRGKKLKPLPPEALLILLPMSLFKSRTEHHVMKGTHTVNISLCYLHVMAATEPVYLPKRPDQSVRSRNRPCCDSSVQSDVRTRSLSFQQPSHDHECIEGK